MAERYKKVFTQREMLYCPGAPVVINASALLKDNLSGNLLAQIKFTNISNKAILALTVHIDAKNVNGEDVAGIDSYQYLDLNARRNDTFGAKEPIIMPDASARSFTCQCLSVLYTDGTSWKQEDDIKWEVLPAATSLEQKLGTYTAGTYKRLVGSLARYVVSDHYDLWYCTCGTLNHSSETNCYHCQKQKRALIEAMDAEHLKTVEKNYLQIMAEEAEIQQRKSRRIAAIGIIAVMLVLALSILFANLPQITDYSNANQLLRAGEYVAAEEAFAALGDFANAETMILECRYRHALSMLDLDNITKHSLTKLNRGIMMLEELGNYKDAQLQRKEALYQKACYYRRNEEYEKANRLFWELGNYKDSQDLIYLP